MTDAPQIDDRRRLGDLADFILIRVIVTCVTASVVGPIFLRVRHFHPMYPTRDWQFFTVLAFLMVLVLGIPSALSKKGARSWLVVFGMSLSGAGAAVIGGATFGESTWDPLCVALGAVGAALGTAEGLLERSIATTYAGLIGGLLSGSAAAAVVPAMGLHYWYLWGKGDRQMGLFWVVLSMAFIIQFGVALSLALGRWIRDLPKRKQDEPGPAQ